MADLPETFMIELSRDDLFLIMGELRLTAMRLSEIKMHGWVAKINSVLDQIETQRHDQAVRVELERLGIKP